MVCTQLILVQLMFVQYIHDPGTVDTCLYITWSWYSWHLYILDPGTVDICTYLILVQLAFVHTSYLYSWRLFILNPDIVQWVKYILWSWYSQWFVHTWSWYSWHLFILDPRTVDICSYLILVQLTSVHTYLILVQLTTPFLHSQSRQGLWALISPWVRFAWGQAAETQNKVPW